MWFKRTMGHLQDDQKKFIKAHGFKSFLSLSTFKGTLVSNRLGIGACEKLLLSLHTEEEFIRSFIIYLFSTILCLPIGNYVNMDYFHSSVDINRFSEYDWSTHVVYCLMREVKNYQRFTQTQREVDFQIGECLSLLVYNTPRICHVTDGDFEYDAFVNRCRMNIALTYGSQTFHPRNQIPYLNQSNAGTEGVKADGKDVAGLRMLEILAPVMLLKDPLLLMNGYGCPPQVAKAHRCCLVDMFLLNEHNLSHVSISVKHKNYHPRTQHQVV
uniref:Uncharacterized protein n=1 Tax=Oryza punctata TaxID=4537 RepID=A0A0E0JHT0_ORYPU